MSYTTAKDWNFQVFFNCTNDEGRQYSEVKRNEALMYLCQTFERSSRFSVIAKSDKERTLLLSGYVSQRNPCTLCHMKRILGKYSYCKPTALADVIHLMRHFNVDKNISVTGTLYRNIDAKFIMKVISSDNARYLTKDTENTQKVSSPLNTTPTPSSPSPLLSDTSLSSSVSSSSSINTPVDPLDTSLP